MILQYSSRIVLIVIVICITISNFAFADDLHHSKEKESKEKEFAEAFIKLLPDEYQNKKIYIQKCKTISKDCPLKGMVIYADLICKDLDKGRSRIEVLKSFGTFFNNEEGIALIDASIHVVCPHHSNLIK